MDPALAELIQAGDADEDVRVVARLRPGAAPPAGAEVVSRFGDVATWRIRRGDLEGAWEAPEVISLKAPLTLDPHPVQNWSDSASAPPGTEDERRPVELQETGAGVIVACLDWGIDFAHPDFLTADGRSRLLALWDQRGGAATAETPRYGYGVVHERAAIDAATAHPHPYAALGYDPADSDLGHGCHGTHTLSIAAGGGSPATPRGIAPGADLLFVHLDSPRGDGARALGDWVTLLDALDFCLGVAGTRPIVISMSLGSHGGAHDGSSPLERALDYVVASAPGRAICQSAGNYYESRVHTAGRLRPGGSDRLEWLTSRAEANPHQLELWYAGSDRLVVRIESRERALSVRVAPGEAQSLVLGGLTIGRVHHRLGEPNNGKNHVMAFLYPSAPGGRWDVVLEAADVADGRYHCWVERESGAPGGQSHLDETEIVKRTTTNSVCNGMRTITVGAYDALSPDRPLAPFSSSGPTSDGRTKPDLLAPGVRVLAARSTPRGEAPGARATRMSGTSMAAPFLAGTVALMFEAAGRPLAIAETRRCLSQTAEATEFNDERELRAGDGYVDPERAVQAARAIGSAPASIVPDARAVPGFQPTRHAPEPELIQEDAMLDLSTTSVAAGATTTPSTDAVLERLGIADSPAALFDALRSGSWSDDAVVTIVAGPGSRFELEPQAGDILLSRVRGERDLGRFVVLSDGAIHERERCRALGERLLDSGRGFYGHVVTGPGGEILAVRIADPGWRLSTDQMLIRPTAGGLAAADGIWQGERWGEAADEWVPESGPIAAGRLVVEEVALLASHRGTHPDLILRWNAMPDGVSLVDVVVHFHGYSGHAAAMRLDVDKEPKSGLDFSNPADPSDVRPGRSRPTLCILPRGNYFGGRSGAGYDHPALVTPRGLQDLISFSLERFAGETGAQPSVGRLLLTAHSGGGAGVMGALRHNDPHEVHIFDALYGPADRLADWARARLRSELAGGATGALRIAFIEGAGTADHSRAVIRSLESVLASAPTPTVPERYRAQATTVSHNDIPGRLGWLLLADAGARLPVHGARQRAEAEATSNGAGLPVEVDEDTLWAQWEAHPRVHGWYDGGADTYVRLAPLYASHGIDDSAAYLDQNVTTARLLGHSFPAHRALAAALARADATLQGLSPAPDVHSIWSLNARPIRGRSNRLSQHALGLAVDINPATNPLIRATDERDVVRVITAITGVDLGHTQTAVALRQASTTFRATYGEDWLAAQRQQLDAAVQSGDNVHASELRSLIAAATTHSRRLSQLAGTGFFDLDQRLVDALVGAGLTWGGSWPTSKDLMHFELHGTPPVTQSIDEDIPVARLQAPAPGAGITLTTEQEGRIAQRYSHVIRFYRRYAALAMADQRASGVPAVFTLAQGGLESGWGRHMPGDMLFGVKANPRRVPEAERQRRWTREVTVDPHGYNGTEHDPALPLTDPETGEQRTDSRGRPLYTIRVNLWFRRFDSEADSIANHSAFLRSNARYAEAFEHGDDPAEFARAVAAAGYATDPDYERDLLDAIALIDRVAAYVDSHPASEVGPAPLGEAAEPSAEPTVETPPPGAPTLSALEARYFPPPGTPDAAPFSRGSSYEPLIDGRDYFGAIKQRIDALGAGDACYLAGWWLSPAFTFADGTKLGDLLVAKAAAGVDVRVILWVNRQVLDNPRLAGALGGGPYSHVIRDNLGAAEDLRARTAGGAAVLAGRVLIDWSGNAASSHHMKFAVTSFSGDVVAFVGGLDFQQNRLSPPMHPPPSLGWHDAGVLLRGDAAGRALATFVTRWNEASTLSGATYDIGAGRHQYNPAPIAPLRPPTASSAPPSSDTSVQVIRSFPDSKEFGMLHNTPWRTLPSSGVHEVKRTFQNALAAARRYIYIEDQSFNAVDSLFGLLVDACKRGVKVIALIPGRGDPLDTPGAIPATLSTEIQSGILGHLTPTEQANLAVWQLDGIVVHAKLMLVDDEFVEIGSANFMDRSMQYTFQGDDSEISAAAVTSGGLVSDLRMQLWAEHLKVTDPSARAEIRDLSRSLGFWRPGWGSGLSFAHSSSRLVFVGPVAAPVGAGTRARSGSS